MTEYLPIWMSSTRRLASIRSFVKFVDTFTQPAYSTPQYFNIKHQFDTKSIPNKYFFGRKTV